MAADQMQRKRRLIIGVEIGPIHCHDDLAALTNNLANPRTKQLPGLHARIAEQPIDLLDRGLRKQPARLGQRLANQRNRQRRPRHHPERAVGQRQNALGMQILAKNPAHILMNEIELLLRPAHRSPAG